MKKNENRVINLPQISNTYYWSYFDTINEAKYKGKELSEEILLDVKEHLISNYRERLDDHFNRAIETLMKNKGDIISIINFSIREATDYYGNSDGIRILVEESDEAFNNRMKLDKDNAKKSREAKKKKELEDPEYALFKKLSKKYSVKM